MTDTVAQLLLAERTELGGAGVAGVSSPPSVNGGSTGAAGARRAPSTATSVASSVSDVLDHALALGHAPAHHALLNQRRDDDDGDGANRGAKRPRFDPSAVHTDALSEPDDAAA